MIADHCHDLIAVHNGAVFIHRQKPVGVSVKGQAHIGFLINHSGLKLFHMCGTAVGIDVGPVRHIMDGNHIRSQFSQRFYRCIEGSSLRTVHHDFQSG